MVLKFSSPKHFKNFWSSEKEIKWAVCCWRNFRLLFRWPAFSLKMTFRVSEESKEERNLLAQLTTKSSFSFLLLFGLWRHQREQNNNWLIFIVSLRSCISLDFRPIHLLYISWLLIVFLSLFYFLLFISHSQQMKMKMEQIINKTKMKKTTQTKNVPWCLLLELAACWMNQMIWKVWKSKFNELLSITGIQKENPKTLIKALISNAFHNYIVW